MDQTRIVDAPSASGSFPTTHWSAILAAGHEDGTFVYPEKTPGGGNAGFRRQMKVLTDFINGFDFVRMKPDVSIVKSADPAKRRVQALVEPGRQYAIYLKGSPLGPLVLELPAGRYDVEWIDVISGRLEERLRLEHRGGDATLRVPAGYQEIALRVLGNSARK